MDTLREDGHTGSQQRSIPFPFTGKSGLRLKSHFAISDIPDRRKSPPPPLRIAVETWNRQRMKIIFRRAASRPRVAGQVLQHPVPLAFLKLRHASVFPAMRVRLIAEIDDSAYQTDT